MEQIKSKIMSELYAIDLPGMTHEDLINEIDDMISIISEQIDYSYNLNKHSITEDLYRTLDRYCEYKDMLLTELDSMIDLENQ